MKPLVIQFQEDLTVGNKRITELLRTAKLISVKLGLGSVQEWIEHELSGYPGELAKLPKYRFLGGGHLQFFNPYHGWIPAMGSRLPDIPIFQPIGELETFAKGDSMYFTPARNYPLTDYSGSDDLISNFPQRIEFALSIVQGVQDAVRNRLLDWSIELEQQGILGENMSFKEEEKQIAKSQTFNIEHIEHMTGVIGDVSGSKVEIHDFSSIHKTLKDAGVPKSERDALEKIMDDLATAPFHEKPRLIQKMKDWVVKNQDILGAAVSIVMKAIPQ